MRQHAGFSLIELVVFIVVISFAISGIFLAFTTALQKAPLSNPQTIAIELASARMEIIIGQRRINGFSNFSDPCAGGSQPVMCTLPAGITGYTTTSTISTYTVGTDSNYKVINVVVTGPQNARADLKTLVARY